MLLTIKASAKKVFHVTSFVPEGVKQRLAKRRRENLRWTESPDGTVSLQADDRGPVYLSQAEWGAANVRLMYHMMTEGELPGANIGEYLAYTVMIFEFASKYDWQSVLDFDIRYREQQAQHNFRWGKAAIHLETLLLTSRRQATGSNQDPRQQQGRKSGQVGRGRTDDDGVREEICRLYASRGDCPYGERCKFRHMSRD